MKTILFSLLLVMVSVTFKGYAQIKVYEDKRVKFFGDRSTDDQNKDLSLQVYGKYGSYLTNGRIGFGEYNAGAPPFDINKVFVGELGNNFDSDRLELCGSKGVYLTWGQGYDHNNVIAKLDQEYDIVFDVWTNVSKFKFNTDVYAHGLIINSDKRFKENIQTLKDPVQKIRNLKPVTYSLKRDKALMLSSSVAPETEKQERDFKELKSAGEKIKVMEDKRFGFVAQDLQNILPELVDEDEDGLYVDYLGLIPVLVETLKEQQQQLASIQNLINKNKTNTSKHN